MGNCTRHKGKDRDLFGCVGPEPETVAPTDCRCGKPLLPVHDCDAPPIDCNCGCASRKPELIVVDQYAYEQLVTLVEANGVARIHTLVDVIASKSNPNG